MSVNKYRKNNRKLLFDSHHYNCLERIVCICVCLCVCLCVCVWREGEKDCKCGKMLTFVEFRLRVDGYSGFFIQLFCRFENNKLKEKIFD